MKRSVAVHSGKFHADDVLAVSLLLFYGLVDKDKIIRTRDSSILENAEYVCDVGGVYNEKIKRFDHHQESFKEDYSSAGLILNYLENSGIATSNEAGFLRRCLVNEVDAHDIGKKHSSMSSFSMIVESFYIISENDSEEIVNAQFKEAVDFTISLLNRYKMKLDYCYKVSVPAVRKALENQKDHCIFLSKRVDWLFALFLLKPKNDEIFFVISEENSNKWNARCVPKSLMSFETFRTFPKSWCGKQSEDLSKESNLEGGIFCHKNGFLSVWDNKHSAVMAIKMAMQENIKNKT